MMVTHCGNCILYRLRLERMRQTEITMSHNHRYVYPCRGFSPIRVSKRPHCLDTDFSGLYLPRYLEEHNEIALPCHAKLSTVKDGE